MPLNKEIINQPTYNIDLVRTSLQLSLRVDWSCASSKSKSLTYWIFTGTESWCVVGCRIYQYYVFVFLFYQLKSALGFQVMQ